MDKRDRHLLIKEIITQKSIETQSQLLNELEEKGVVLTQTTVSRDIKELNIIKVLNSDGIACYAILANNDKTTSSYLREILQTYANHIAQVGFLNIIRTDLGAADVIGAEIDEKKSPEIIGTLAGMDTIVLISKNEEDATIINHRLSSFINEK